MKSRPAPSPINYRRRLPAHLRNDPQVMKWTQRLLGDAEARPKHLSEEQTALVMGEVLKRRDGLSPAEVDLYYKAMQETTPVLAAPELERSDLAGDLALIGPSLRCAGSGLGGRARPVITARGPTSTWPGA